MATCRYRTFPTADVVEDEVVLTGILIGGFDLKPVLIWGRLLGNRGKRYELKTRHI